MKRFIQQSIRLTPEQHEKATMQAKKYNMSFSEYVRFCIVNKEPKINRISLEPQDLAILRDFGEHVIPCTKGFNNALNGILYGIKEEERKKILLGGKNMTEWAKVMNEIIPYILKNKDFFQQLQNKSNLG